MYREVAMTFWLEKAEAEPGPGSWKRTLNRARQAHLSTEVAESRGQVTGL